METAVNGLWDAAPRLGDRIAVVGAGVVGCLVAALAARLPGTRELIDRHRRAARRHRRAAGLRVRAAGPGAPAMPTSSFTPADTRTGSAWH
jgi:glycine/D-amino acid oxidase-like deaminating enzyme